MTIRAWTWTLTGEEMYIDGILASVSLPEIVDIWVDDVRMISPMFVPTIVTNYTTIWTASRNRVLLW
jgi:cellulase/cellobiase CelA1